MAIIAVLLYYARYNIKLSWKKSPSATYVTKCFQHAPPSLPKRVSSFFNRRPTNTRPQNLEKGVRKVEICNTGLVSTTNQDAIIRSNTITHDTRNKRNNPNNRIYDQPPFDNNTVANGGGPLKSPRRLSIKNIKNFAFNSNVFSKNVQCSSTSSLNKFDNSENNKGIYTKKPPPIPDVGLKSPRRMSFKNLKKFTFNSNSIPETSHVSYGHLKENSAGKKIKNVDKINVNENVETVQKLSVKELAKKLNNPKL